MGHYNKLTLIVVTDFVVPNYKLSFTGNYIQLIINLKN